MNKNKSMTISDMPAERYQKYFNNRVKGMNKLQAALKAGYTRNTARNAKENIEDRPQYQALLNDVIPTELLMNGLREDLTHEEWQCRAKSRELAFKLRGDFIEKREVTTKFGDDLEKAIKRLNS